MVLCHIKIGINDLCILGDLVAVDKEQCIGALDFLIMWHIFSDPCASRSTLFVKEVFYVGLSGPYNI